MPRVSVVIPTYNRENYITETIESVLAQTYRDFEIIVVDDGSTDNTRQAVGTFRDDSRVNYIYQENQGVSAARNTAIRASRGEYIAILDSDDIWLKDALEKRVEVLDKYPGVGLVFGQSRLMDADGTVYRVRGSSFMNSSGIVDRTAQIKELLFGCNILPSASMIRGSCFDEVGVFHNDLTFAEDRLLFIRLTKRYQVAYISEPLVKYRIHPGSLQFNADPRTVEKAYALMLHEVFDDPALASRFASWKSQIYGYAYRRVAAYAYGKDMKMTRRYLAKSVRAYPEALLHSGGLSIAWKYGTSLLPGGVWLALRALKRHFLASKKRRI